MKAPTLTKTRQYHSAIKRSKRKYVTSESLSKEIGVFPDVITDVLSFFDPLVKMDYTYDLRELLPMMEQYIDDLVREREKQKRPRLTATIKETTGYESIDDFVFQKFIFKSSGLFNYDATLNDKDLRVLKKLINLEQAERRDKKRKK